MTLPLILLFILVILIAGGVILWRRNTRPTTTGELVDQAIRMDPDLAHFVEALNSVNDETDEVYLDALRRIRERPEALLNEITRLEDEVAPSDYALRRSLVLAADELRHPAALPYLHHLLFKPWNDLPPVEHSGGAAVEETILRSMAIEAVEHIAAGSQDGEALQLLVETVRLPSLTLRALSLAALRAVDPQGAYLNQAIASLPAEQHYLLELRRVELDEVPQILDPRLHLDGPELNLPGAPLLPDQRTDEGLPAPSTHLQTAPQIRKGG